MDPVPEIFILLSDRLKVNVDNAPNIMEKVSGIKITLKEQNVANVGFIMQNNLESVSVLWSQVFLKSCEGGEEIARCGTEDVWVLYNEG